MKSVFKLTDAELGAAYVVNVTDKSMTFQEFVDYAVDHEYEFDDCYNVIIRFKDLSETQKMKAYIDQVETKTDVVSYNQFCKDSLNLPVTTIKGNVKMYF